MKKLLFFAIAIIGFSAVSFGQSQTSTATSNASATVLTAIKILNSTPLNFGVFSATGSPSKVIVDQSDSRATSTATLFTTGGVVAKTGVFDITGTPAATFNLVLPVSDVTLNGPSGATMKILAGTGFSPSLLTAGNVLDVDGKATLKLGATLEVGATQTSGVYTGSYDVTVNYN